jgi:predicted MFS family arabinose efflux permease
MNIYHIIAFALLNVTGYKGARTVSTLYALELGADPFVIGALLATYALFPLLLAVHVGRVIDRIGVRIPLIGGLSVVAAGVFLPFAAPGLVWLFAALALTGAGFIFTHVSLQTLVGTLGGGASRTRNFSNYSLGIAATDVTGPVLAGLSIDIVGHGTTYLVLSLLITAALALAWYLRPRLPAGQAHAEAPGPRRMVDLVRAPALRSALVMSGVVMAAVDLFQLYFPIYGHSVGLSASAIGIVLGAFGVGAVVARAMIPALARRFGEEHTLFRSLFIVAGIFILIPFFSGFYPLAAISFALGLVLGLGQPLSTILTYNHSPAGRTSEALGLRIAIMNLTHVVAPVAFGAIGTALGLAPVFWVSSALIAAGGWAGRAPAARGNSRA